MPGRCIQTEVVCQQCGLVATIDPFCLTPSDVRFCSLACTQAYRIEAFKKRFWSRVNKNGPVSASSPELQPCWLWTGICWNGYGKIWLRNGNNPARSAPAHRLAWEFTHGPFSPELFVMHLCEACYPPGDITCRRCCNPAHLHLGTPADNNNDKARFGRAGWTGDHRGSRHGRAILTEAIVLEIRARHASGVTQVALATEFGISQSLVSFLVNRKRWAHV